MYKNSMDSKPPEGQKRRTMWRQWDEWGRGSQVGRRLVILYGASERYKGAGRQESEKEQANGGVSVCACQAVSQAFTPGGG